MNKIIDRLTRELRRFERQADMAARAAKEGRGHPQGLRQKRHYLLGRIAELSLAIEALRAVASKPMPMIGVELGHSRGADADGFADHISA